MQTVTRIHPQNTRCIKKSVNVYIEDFDINLDVYFDARNIKKYANTHPSGLKDILKDQRRVELVRHVRDIARYIPALILPLNLAVLTWYHPREVIKLKDI